MDKELSVFQHISSFLKITLNIPNGKERPCLGAKAPFQRTQPTVWTVGCAPHRRTPWSLAQACALQVGCQTSGDSSRGERSVGKGRSWAAEVMKYPAWLAGYFLVGGSLILFCILRRHPRAHTSVLCLRLVLTKFCPLPCIMALRREDQAAAGPPRSAGAAGEK